MNPDRKNLSFRILALIAEPKIAKRAEKIFRAESVPIFYRLAAKGTATSEMMDILGLGGVDKTMLLGMMPTASAGEMLRKFRKELKLGAAGSGIAFTLPLSAANNLILRMLQKVGAEETDQTERKAKTMTDRKYALIAAIINQGYSDDVAAAARDAGAKGGTVLHSRRAGNEQAMGFWGLSVQDEKEIVLIVTDEENKSEIMRAISEKCGIRSDAEGVVMSMPIDSVIGLGEA